MRKVPLVLVLLAYTVVGWLGWLLVFLFTLPYIWKGALSGRRIAMKRAPYFVPPKHSPDVGIKSGQPDTTGPAPKAGPIDIAAKLEAGTMTPQDWAHVSIVYGQREGKC